MRKVTSRLAARFRAGRVVAAVPVLLAIVAHLPVVAAPPPAPAAATAAAAPRVVERSPDEFMARAIARSSLGMPGGATVAIWDELARGKGRTRYCTRYLTDQQVPFTSYGDFLRRFSASTTDPRIRGSRALIVIGHAGFGLGLQVAVTEKVDREALRVPARVRYDQDFAPLEFVAYSRIRQDLAGKYDLIALGQCNPRACLRFVEKGIPVGEELYRQIKRLSDRPRQLTIVRNPEEDIYLVGYDVVHVEKRREPLKTVGLPLVVAPDGIGEQAVNSNPDRSSQTDVFILSGNWTTEPTTSIKEDYILRPSRDMLREADQRVKAMVAEESRGRAPVALQGEGRRRSER